MLEIENRSFGLGSDSTQVMADAQTIINFFIDAVDKNDCNVKVIMGFYQELQSTLESIADLQRAFEPTALTPWPKYNSKNELIEEITKPDTPPASSPLAQAVIQALKEECFNCKLKLPRIKFDNDLKFLYNKLSFQLEVYKLHIDKPQVPNFCHLAHGLQKTCIPDIMKLVVMLLTAYAAILALSKLPSFSLGAFIKGIISTLLAKVVGSLKISLDMSSTGLPCLLAVLEELAKQVPTNEAIYQNTTEELRENTWLKDYTPVSIYEKNLQESLKKKEITEEEYTAKLDKYRKKNDPITHYKGKLEDEIGKAEEAVSEIFTYVNDTIQACQDDINSYIASILGVINYFECEDKRTGPDFSEIVEYISKINTLLNILSSILYIFLKKTLRKICKDHKSVQQIKKELGDLSVNEPLTQQEVREMMEEFTQATAKLEEDGLGVLIYDRPKPPTFPKLTLLGCNFKEFAEAHRLDNMIETVINEILEENKEAERKAERTKRNFPNMPWSVFGLTPIPNRTVNVPGWNTTKFTKPLLEDSIKKAETSSSVLISSSVTYNYFGNTYINHIDRYIDNARRGIKDYLDGNVNRYFNIINNINATNFNYTNKFYEFPAYVSDIDIYIGEVVRVIDISYPGLKDTYGGFPSELEELTDLIYDNPFKKPQDGTTPVKNETTLDRDPLEDITSGLFDPDINSALGAQQSKYSPPAGQECRSVEDVMNILKNIGV